MSSLKVNQILNTSNVEQYLCKAWVNFNGTGTVAIRASGNVSSITDNGTGDYTVNFTSSLSDANYSVVTSAKETDNNTISGNGTISMPFSFTTSSVKIRNSSAGGAAVDPVFVQVAVFR